MMRYFIAMITAGLCFSVCIAEADIYKSIAPDGSVVYTNTPYRKTDRLVIKERRKPVQEAPQVQATSKSEVKASGVKLSHVVPPPGKPMPVHARKTAYSGIVEEKAKKHNVDPKLVKSVIRAESNWNHRAVSPKGAMGLMQLMPQTANLMGVNNPFDPEQNIEGGVKYLRHLLTRFEGNLTLAIAAYNAGPMRVERKGGVPSIPETVTYVQRVIGDYTGVAPLASLPLMNGPKSATRIYKVVLRDGSIAYTNVASSLPSLRKTQ